MKQTAPLLLILAALALAGCGSLLASAPDPAKQLEVAHAALASLPDGPEKDRAIAALAPAEAAATRPATDDGGKPNSLETIGGAVAAVGPFVPGYGVLATALGGVLAAIGARQHVKTSRKAKMTEAAALTIATSIEAAKAASPKFAQAFAEASDLIDAVQRQTPEAKRLVDKAQPEAPALTPAPSPAPSPLDPA